MSTHVLIVDDDELVLSGLRSSLEDLGFKVSTAPRSAQALELMAADSSVDLVLTDLVMAEMGGIELLRELRQRYPHVPVVVITGHGSPDSAVDAMREGAADYIQKPIRAEELARRIDTIVGSNRLRRRLEEERNRAREEEQNQAVRSSRLERYETALRMARGLAQDLGPLVDLFDRYCAKLADQCPPADRAAWEQGLRLLRELRRIAADPQEPAEKLFLEDLVHSAVETLEVRSARDARPDANIEIHLPARSFSVRVYPSLLRSTLSGLLAGLIRALPRGGRLTIQLSREEHDAPWGHLVRGASGTYVALHMFSSVRLRAEEIEHLAEPYAEQRLTQSHGLLFPMVLGCMRIHRGLTRVRSVTAPDGTEVALLFPWTEADTAQAARPKAVSGHRVLVVDDSSYHRERAVALLKELHAEVAEANSTAEAMAKLAQAERNGEPFEAVLVDLILGEPTDGVDLVRQIAGLSTQYGLILMTGFADLDRISEARAVGVRAVLQKPFSRDDLAAALEAALGPSKRESPPAG